MRLARALGALSVTCGLLLAAAAEGCAASDPTPAPEPPPESKSGDLPGAEPFPLELSQRLRRAVEAKGKAYVPRTRHKREDGSAMFTNRLSLESSPYLLQHAHNPVNWYPWGDEAFETARRLGRPVLLSIGYSTCHWCHVMEEESFEDLEIAAYMNANYIAIKVDREERPDVDAIYMAAVQLLNRRGGWPMTTWLNHRREPFYGGTYFPPRDGARGNRKGFLTLLRELKQTYESNPVGIADRARQIASRIQQTLQPEPGTPVMPGAAELTAAMNSYRQAFDAAEGGLSRAPKFPSSLPLRLLLRQHLRADADALSMATLTLRKMARGGIYDQIGGGFHRYSVDARWLVPHFEKMLYDNALLTVAYLDGYQVTGDPEFARIAREVLQYVSREMTAPEGGFYSATDADSLDPHGEREEGWFFTWTPAEIDRVLGEDARLVKAYYNVSPRGNFEGRNILNVSLKFEPGKPGALVDPLVEAAAAAGIPLDAAREKLATARNKLYRERAKRPAPLRDDKILAAWNGLMISAFAQGGFILDEPEFTRRAEKAARFVLDAMVDDGRLKRSYKGGSARHNGYLEDYAFLIAGVLDLYESTFELGWLQQAIRLQATLDAHYNKPGGGYYRTSDDHETLLARETPARDGAEPAGNSVAALNLMRLHELTSDERFRSAADGLLGAFGARLKQSPRALSEMLHAVDFRVGEPKEIVLVEGETSDGAVPFLNVLRETYLPNKVVAVVEGNSDRETLAKVIPLTRGKTARAGKTTAYVCTEGICKLPTTKIETFVQQLAN